MRTQKNLASEVEESCEGDCEGCEECNEGLDESSCTSEDDEDDVEEGNAFGSSSKKQKKTEKLNLRWVVKPIKSVKTKKKLLWQKN